MEVTLTACKKDIFKLFVSPTNIFQCILYLCNLTANKFRIQYKKWIPCKKIKLVERHPLVRSALRDKIYENISL